MLFKRTIVKTPLLSFIAPTKIIFNENIEFTCSPRSSDNIDFKFHVTDIKGEFEIIKIQPKSQTRGDKPVKFDKTKSEFIIIKYDEQQKEGLCDFAITIDAECKKVNLEESILRIPYTIFISEYNLKCLNVYEYLEGAIHLPGGLKFKYYVNKSKEGKVEIIVKNEYSVDITDKKPDNEPPGWHANKQKSFRHQACDSKDLELTLWFMYNKEDIKTAQKNEEPADEAAAMDQEDNEKEDDVGTNESDYVMLKSNPSNNSIKKLTLYDVMSDTTYSDVIFITSQGVEVPSYRCVLAKCSEKMAQIFEESGSPPVKINAEEFNEKTVKAALDFCYGKNNAIAGKEIAIYDFADKWGFKKLKETCLFNIEHQLNLDNVYDIIKIAYLKELNSLKDLCTKIMRENKAHLDPSKLFKLPRNIGEDLNLFSE